MRTVGVEEELLVVDAVTARPAARGDDVAAAVDTEAVDGQVEHEFKREQAETGTPPRSALADVRADLVALRRQLADAAADHGSAVAALGASPLRVRPVPTDDERYRRMHERFALLSEQQLTCGQHVHVSVDSDDEGVAVLDRIRPWTAVLTAIAANSPFWQGVDSGYASYRTVSWGLWPTAGPADVFGSAAAYDGAVRDLVATGAAMDDAMIYFDARLSRRYPTVELRVTDVCLDVDDAVLVAALTRGLVERAAADWGAGVEPDPVPVGLLRAARWRAARYGLSGELVNPTGGALVPASQAVGALVDHVRPALSDDDLTAVDAGVERLRSSGNGAEAQRAAYVRTGRLTDVVRMAVDRTVAG